MAADLHIEGDFTVSGAAAQREAWLGWLTETSDADAATWPEVRLALHAVESVDSAGVQLLLALQHSLAQRGQRLLLEAPAACIGEALQRFGLSDQLPSAPARTARDAASDACQPTSPDGAPQALPESQTRPMPEPLLP